jgi:hypothetical protein
MVRLWLYLQDLIVSFSFTSMQKIALIRMLCDATYMKRLFLNDWRSTQFQNVLEFIRVLEHTLRNIS